jgi:hypothetical protein
MSSLCARAMVVVLLAVLAACSGGPRQLASHEIANRDVAAARPQTAARLTRAQVVAVVANNTIGGANALDTAQAYFDLDGTYRMRRSSGIETGGWHVARDGEICIRAASDEIERCYQLYDEGQFIRAEQTDGTPVGTFVVLVGNPQNL